MRWVELWGFLWWAPSAKRKDHHGVSSGWISVWHRSHTGLSSGKYTIWADPNYTWGLAILADSLLFSVNNILAGLWLNCISSVEITFFLLADILLQHRALFQLSLFRSTYKLTQSLFLQWFVKLMGPSVFSFIILIVFFLRLIITCRLWVIYVREDDYSNV